MLESLKSLNLLLHNSANSGLIYLLIGCYFIFLFIGFDPLNMVISYSIGLGFDPLKMVIPYFLGFDPLNIVIPYAFI